LRSAQAGLVERNVGLKALQVIGAALNVLKRRCAAQAGRSPGGTLACTKVHVERERVKRLPPALALGVLVALAGLLAVALPAGADIEENYGLQWLFDARGPVQPPSEVVVVAIDELSARKLGLPDKPRDWPRSLHAELVDHLAAAGARVVCFDMTFETPSAVPENDDAFARAIGRARNVLLTESIHREVVTMKGAAGEPIGSATIEQPIPPLPELQNAALGYAPFLLPKSARVNLYWTFWGGAADAPTLPVLAFHAYAPEAVRELQLMLGQVKPEADLAHIRSLRQALMHDAPLRDRVLSWLGDKNAGLGKHNHRLIRSLVQLHSSHETSHLNFYGPARSINTVPYFRVLEAARSGGAATDGSLGPGAFKGKAVFVGYSAATPAGQDRLRDHYRTVYSDAQELDLNGVEILATAFANLLEDRALKPVPTEWEALIVLAWGMALGWACHRLRPWRLAAAGAVAMAWLATAYALFVGAAIWLPFAIAIGVQAPLALLAGFWLRYRETKTEREAIRQAFGYYVPSTAVDQLARTVGPMTASNRVVFGACLASDAQNYTTLAEKMDPRELGTLMNAYYAEMFVPVERRGGVVIDVVGDAMVAIWAKASTDAELRLSACEAALDIIEALDRFNQLQGEHMALPTRLGLHSGEMLVGSIGGSHHYEYRAVGDIVNTASRIQGLNKVLGTRLLASQETMAGMDQFVNRPLGSFLMAGKTSAVSVVELLGRKQDDASQTSDLCKAFAEALSEYQARRWPEASAGFSNILVRLPDDGPSRFYRERCELLVANAPGGDWAPTLRIDTK
jgi:adenylate cyclase